jgi:hypothetical protein
MVRGNPQKFGRLADSIVRFAHENQLVRQKFIETLMIQRTMHKASMNV